MAEAIVSAVVGEAVSRVISLVMGNFGHRQSSEAKLQRICRLLIRIHSVVEEAKARQIENQGALQWLRELIDSEYEARYLLDTVGCGELELEDDEKSSGLQAPSLSLFNPAKRVRVAVKSVLSRRAIVGAGESEIDRVLESLQGVSSDLAEFITLLQGYQPNIRRPLATNIFLEGQMFGRHVEKERIITFLLHESPEQLGVLPIVGDIGVGKTTLVQHACDDPRVRNHFPLIMLFHCSCTYSTTTTTTTTEATAVVLRSKHVIGEAGADTSDPVKLIERGFGDKRFLMVFEDVDTHRHKRRALEELLTGLTKRGARGSKVVFTTTSRRVAHMMGTVEPVVLKVLPRPEYWFFFKAHAFAGADVEENPRLVAAGREIARKLSGSFFGAKIVGGLLRDHPDPRFWCQVLRSNIGGLSLLGDGIDYIADLAQNLLPDHVSLSNVTVSKDRYSSQMELARFRDLCERPGREAAACLGDELAFARVVLCRSVLPFYSQHYYVAYCTVDPGNRCS